jgi:predicted transport protein
MSFQTDKAIKRIFNTFKRLGKQIYKEDIDALKTINESLDFYKTSFVADNKIFAKLLALYLKEKYSNVKDIDFVIKQLNKDLEQPLSYHLELLKVKIQSTETIEYIKTLTIDVPENEFNDVEALTNRENEFWDVHHKNIFKQIKEQYSADFINNNFYNTATEILQTVEFYK